MTPWGADHPGSAQPAAARAATPRKAAPRTLRARTLSRRSSAAGRGPAEVPGCSTWRSAEPRARRVAVSRPPAGPSETPAWAGRRDAAIDRTTRRRGSAGQNPGRRDRGPPSGRGRSPRARARRRHGRGSARSCGRDQRRRAARARTGRGRRDLPTCRRARNRADRRRDPPRGPGPGTAPRRRHPSRAPACPGPLPTIRDRPDRRDPARPDPGLSDHPPICPSRKTRRGFGRNRGRDRRWTRDPVPALRRPSSSHSSAPRTTDSEYSVARRVDPRPNPASFLRPLSSPPVHRIRPVPPTAVGQGAVGAQGPGEAGQQLGAGVEVHPEVGQVQVPQPVEMGEVGRVGRYLAVGADQAKAGANVEVLTQKFRNVQSTSGLPAQLWG